MCNFKFFKQNVCTVNVHEMYYKFNPGPSPVSPSIANGPTSQLITNRTKWRGGWKERMQQLIWNIYVILLNK
jgi:hypothetical protein